MWGGMKNELSQKRLRGRLRAGVFFPPLPLPLPYFEVSNSALESFFGSPQLSFGRKSNSLAEQSTPALQASCKI